ncbi:MAG: hypothetical protein V7694_25875 [Rhodococcus sp. (in: high G+C Gram-positive bacteria)]
MTTPTPTPNRGRTLARRAGKAAAMTAAALTLAVVFAGPASAQDFNPINGIKPSFEFLGPAFQNVWARVAASIWGVLLAGASVKLLVALYKMRAAKAGGYGAEMSDSMGEAKVAGVAVGALAIGGVIVGAIMFVANPG